MIFWKKSNKKTDQLFLNGFFKSLHKNSAQIRFIQILNNADNNILNKINNDILSEISL